MVLVVLIFFGGFFGVLGSSWRLLAVLIDDFFSGCFLVFFWSLMLIIGGSW